MTARFARPRPDLSPTRSGPQGRSAVRVRVRLPTRQGLVCDRLDVGCALDLRKDDRIEAAAARRARRAQIAPPPLGASPLTRTETVGARQSPFERARAARSRASSPFASATTASSRSTNTSSAVSVGAFARARSLWPGRRGKCGAGGLKSHGCEYCRAPMDFAAPAELDEIRTSVRELCAGFPGEYWRELEPDRYPEEFVAALTEHGWLAALIPEEYGGAGLGLTAASVILEEINASGGNAAGPAMPRCTSWARCSATGATSRSSASCRQSPRASSGSRRSGSPSPPSAPTRRGSRRVPSALPVVT